MQPILASPDVSGLYSDYNYEKYRPMHHAS